MRHGMKYTRRRTAMPAVAVVLGALALAGCSSGNIGESWQCPLARGGTCDSVAGADPAVPAAASEAVPDRGAARKPVLREPLYRVRPQASREASAEEVRLCEAGCGFDLFGWLARLFGAEEGADDARSADGAPQPLVRAVAADARTAAAAPGYAPESPPEPLDLPPEPAPADDDPGGDDLRTEEVLARIWIAPFVDANGVYREAAHVRVVLEPAGWRLR